MCSNKNQYNQVLRLSDLFSTKQAVQSICHVCHVCHLSSCLSVCQLSLSIFVMDAALAGRDQRQAEQDKSSSDVSIGPHPQTNDESHARFHAFKSLLENNDGALLDKLTFHNNEIADLMISVYEVTCPLFPVIVAIHQSDWLSTKWNETSPCCKEWQKTCDLKV